MTCTIYLRLEASCEIQALHFFGYSPYVISDCNGWETVNGASNEVPFVRRLASANVLAG